MDKGYVSSELETKHYPERRLANMELREETVEWSGEVQLIFDPNYGERLRSVPTGTPVWVTMSDINGPVVRSLWEERPDRGSIMGITGFSEACPLDTDRRFLDYFESLDLHHGPYSTSSPYTKLSVVGIELTENIRGMLLDLGFDDLKQSSNGFTAIRSKEQAKKLCE